MSIWDGSSNGGGSSSGSIWSGDSGGTTYKKDPSKTDPDKQARQLASTLQRMKESGDDNYKDLLKAYGRDIPKNVRKQYGIDDPKYSVAESAVQKVQRVPGGSTLLKGLSLIGRPGTAVRTAINDVQKHKLGDLAGDVGKAITTGASDAPDSMGGLLGKKNPGGFKGIVYSLANFAGTAVLDPLSYVGGGTTAAGKGALKAVEEGGGRELAEAITKQGVKKVGEAEVKSALLKAAEKNVAETGTKKTAEEIAQKQLELLTRRGQGGLTLAGRTVVSGEKLAPITDAITKNPLSMAVRDSRAAQDLAQKFSTFHDTARKFGTDAAAEARNAWGMGRHEGELISAAQEKGLNEVLKAGKVTNDELTKVIGPAIEAGATDTLEPRLKAVADHLAELGTQRSETLTEAGIHAPIENQGNLLGDIPKEQAIPQTFTDAGKLALKKDPEGLFAKLGIHADQIQAALQGQSDLLPGKTLAEKESILTDALGPLSKGRTYLEQNPVRAQFARNAEANSAAGISKALDRISDIRVDGKAILHPAVEHINETLPATRVIDGQIHDLANIAGRQVYAPRAIISDLKRMSEVHPSGYWSKMIDGIQGQWKAYATVPSLAFHSRNMQGNIWLNWLAGLHDLSYYGKAARLQFADSKLAEKLGVELHLAPTDVKVLGNLEKGAIKDSGFFAGDIADKASASSRALEGETAKSAKLLNKAKSALGTHGPIIQGGQNIAATVENNARIAHYLWAIDKGMSHEGAVQSVKKYLFDYADLTPFERDKLKKVIPFYTFMRKNTPIELSELARQPGTFSGAATARRTVAGDSAEGGAIPGWAVGGGQVQVSGGLKGILAPGSKSPVTAGLDLPFSNAADTLGPLVQAVTLATNTLRGKPTPGGIQSVANSLVNLPSGGVVEGVKFLIEQNSKKDLFTGANIKDPSWKRALGAYNPLIEKLMKLGEGSLATQLAKMVYGVNINEITDSRQRGELARRLKEAQDRATKDDVPTQAELKKGQATTTKSAGIW